MFKRLIVVVAGASLAIAAVVACADAGSRSSRARLVLGFAQVGGESAWRVANTRSIRESAREAGVELKFSDGQERQENQIAAIRSFIRQKVDVIAFSPVVATGWDTVLREAGAAHIPVILTDRAVDSAPSLYTTFLGSDSVEEGKRAGQWLAGQSKDPTARVNIVELGGTVGSAPAIGRKRGFEGAIASNPRLKVIVSRSGDFTRAQGKEAVQALLKAHKDVDVLFAHNDDMGLGAMQAIEEAGLIPGADIKIVTIDGTKDGMRALAAGKFNYIVECNPLLGHQLMDLARMVKAGVTVQKQIFTFETVFDQAKASEVLPAREY